MIAIQYYKLPDSPESPSPALPIAIERVLKPINSEEKLTTIDVTNKLTEILNRHKQSLKEDAPSYQFGQFSRPLIINKKGNPTFFVSSTRLYSTLSNYITPAPTEIINKHFHHKSGLKNLIVKYYNILNFQSLENIIKAFFNDELQENQRYFLLLKVRLGDYSWRTLHHGIITSRSYVDNYYEFIQSQLNILSEEYNNEDNYTLVAFQYFVIPKSRWSQFPEGKWMHIQRKPSEKINIKDFHLKYNIPINMDYTTWGEIIFSSSQILVIENKPNFTVNIDKELGINTIITGNIKFTDHILREQNGRYFGVPEWGANLRISIHSHCYF